MSLILRIHEKVNADGGMEGPTYNFSSGISWDEWFEQRGLKNEKAFGDFFLLNGYIANNVPFDREINDPEFAYIIAIDYNSTQKTYGNRMLIWNNTWSQETTLPWRLSDRNAVLQITRGGTDNAKLSASSGWVRSADELQKINWAEDNLPYRLGFVSAEVLEKMFLGQATLELWMSGGLLNWRNFPYELTVKAHPVYPGVWQGICPEHGNKSLWGGWTHDNYGSQYQNQIKDLIKDGSIYAIDAPEESNWEYIICRRCRDDEADSSLATLEDLFA